MSGFALPFAGYLGLRAPDGPLFVHHAGSGDPVEQIACLADLGFAGVFDNFLALREVATQEAIGRAASRYSLAFGSITAGLARWREPAWNSTDADTRAALIAMVGPAIEAAQRVGCTRLTVTTDVDRTAPRAPQVTALTDNLRWIADRAAAGRVMLCLEPTAGPVVAPGLLIEHMQEAAAIVAAVDHPAIGLVYDTGHIAAAGDDPFAALAMAAGRIGTVQLADGADRVDLGAGPIDWPPLLRAIRATGYGGLYELEHVPSEPGLDGERALLERLRAIDRGDRCLKFTHAPPAPLNRRKTHRR